MVRGLLVAGSVGAVCLLAGVAVDADDGRANQRGGDYFWQAHSPGFDRGYWRGAEWNGGHHHGGHGHSGHHHGHHHHHHWHGGGIGWGYYGGLYGGYLPYSPYGVYYQPSANYVEYFLPPYYEPAELYYGPQAVKQFLGLDRNFALGPLREPPLRLRPVAARPDPRDAGAAEAAKEMPAVRVSSPTMRRKAERYLAEGDALFRVQKFHSASQKYKLAASAAPDVAETHWRRGHALIATSNFELAAAAFKRALLFEVDTHRGGFQLDDLYGPAAMTKTVHLEILAENALKDEASSDAYFLLGVFLTYDGQRERAEKFFVRALDLAGAGAGHVAAFLDAAALAPAAAAKPPREVVVAPGTEI